MQINNIGGSAESEQTALAVVPKASESDQAVITATPVAKRPMTLQKAAGVIVVVEGLGPDILR